MFACIYSALILQDEVTCTERSMLSLKAAGINFELFGMTYLQSLSQYQSALGVLCTTQRLLRHRGCSGCSGAQAPGVTLVGALPTAVIRTRESKKQESREWAAEVRRLSD